MERAGYSIKGRLPLTVTDGRGPQTRPQTAPGDEKKEIPLRAAQHLAELERKSSERKSSEWPDTAECRLSAVDISSSVSMVSIDNGLTPLG